MLLKAEHELFLYWQDEREIIRRAKEAGEPKPWSSDDILNTYRFCNVKREDDKVTKWIAKNIRKPYEFVPTLPVMLAIARWTNNPETLQYLIHSQAWPLDNTWTELKLEEALKAYKSFGKKVYNPAYVISPCGTTDKDRFVARVVSYVYANLNTMPRDSMADVFIWLNSFYGWGQFMSYQVLVDLRHTRFLNQAPDRATFAAFGPGTTRGLNRLFGRPLDKKPNPLHLTVELSLLHEMNKIELEASDICNCLCEFDKYMRARNGEGRPKQYYK